MSQQNCSKALSGNSYFLPGCFLCDICVTLPEMIPLYLGSLAERPDNSPYYWQWIKHIFKLCIKRQLIFLQSGKGEKREERKKGGKEAFRFPIYASSTLWYGNPRKDPHWVFVPAFCKSENTNSRDSSWGTVSTWKKYISWYIFLIYYSIWNICIS